MHDVAFADAVRPAQCVILKLLMLDYSIGHELLLIRQRNPLVMLSQNEFVLLDDSTQRSALIRAVIVCSQTWKQNQNPPRWMRLWGLFIRKSDFALAIAEFRNYRAAGMLYPPGPEAEADTIANGKKENEGRALGGPFIARLYNFIATLPEREVTASAYDYPFGMATFLYFTHLESEGDMRIENVREAQIREEMAGHRADVELEAKCQP